MNSNKKYIKILIFIILLSAIFFFTIGIGTITNHNEEYVMLENDTYYYRKYNNWYSEKDKSLVQLQNWNKFHIYTNHKKLGNYYFYYDDKVYIFNKKKEAINYEGSLIAFSSSKYQDVDFDLIKLEENPYIDSIFKEKKLDSIKKLTSNEVINTDIDGDGKEEQLYVVSNRFPIESPDTDKYFSFVFLVKNSTVTILYSDIETSDDAYSGCKPYIRNIIKIAGIKQKYIILECAYYSNNGIVSKLYGYKKGKYMELAS